MAAVLVCISSAFGGATLALWGQARSERLHSHASPVRVLLPLACPMQPMPKTLNHKRKTLNAERSTLNPETQTLNFNICTLGPKPSTVNPEL